MDMITQVPTDAISPRPTNPRTHSKKQLKQIRRSIERFGFVIPILVDRNNRIIAGHGRWEAAKMIGLKELPIIRRDHWNEEEARAYVIADNKLAENAGWDYEQLAIEFEELGLVSADLDLELIDTGFEMPEIDTILYDQKKIKDAAVADPDDVAPEPDSGPAITKPGDLWLIGDHRLLCGDALDPEVYTNLIGGEKAQLVCTDPPYNVRVDGHVSGLGKTKHREFQNASGEMSPDEFMAFLQKVFANLCAVSIDGSIHFVFMDWRHIAEITTAGHAVYSELKNLCVWAKTNGGMGSLYRSRHEFVFVFKSGKAVHINNVQLGRYGRHRTNLWDYAGINSFGRGREEALESHPTVKPVAMIADAILDCSHRGGIVLDAFAGSGTTLVAAHRTGRRGYGLEIDPHYCDVILRRLQGVCGLDATLAATGQTFAQVQAERTPLPSTHCMTDEASNDG